MQILNELRHQSHIDLIPINVQSYLNASKHLHYPTLIIYIEHTDDTARGSADLKTALPPSSLSIYGPHAHVGGYDRPNIDMLIA
eukprot:2615424-Pleurochrysis_carterae.AAC.3